MNVALNEACAAGEVERARSVIQVGDPLWVAWGLAGQGGHVAVIEWLAARPTTDADRARGTHQALLLAAQNGHAPAVVALLAAGVAPPPRPVRGGLHAAAQNGHADIVRALLDAGWPADTLDEDGSTPLAEAALAERAHVVALLLERGADPRRADDRGVSPASLAATHGLRAIAALLDGKPRR
jgi:ankyrin repeat protein